MSLYMARVVFAASCILATGCARKPATGPGKVRWDRDVCALCAMALSDPRNSAQVRGGVEKAMADLHVFDDFGCAIIWLGMQPWKEDPRVEIWVNDHRDGAWIDARAAFFKPAMPTPMDYGLAAQAVHEADCVTFGDACAAVLRKSAERQGVMP